MSEEAPHIPWSRVDEEELPPEAKPWIPEEYEFHKKEFEEEDPPLTFQFKFIRDDEMVYTPSSTQDERPVGIGITLYVDRKIQQGIYEKMPVFAGFTATIPGRDNLYFIEMLSGMVSEFSFSAKTGYYKIVFDKHKLIKPVWRSKGRPFKDGNCEMDPVVKTIMCP